MVYCLLGDLDVFGILFTERSGVMSLVYCLLGDLE